MTIVEKRLFTPGPLNTSPTVRAAMSFDVGSRDQAMIDVIDWIRDELLRVAGTDRSRGHDAILMQGSGTFAVEAVLASAISPTDKVLFLVNGAYGRRMVEIARCHALQFEVYEVRENQLHDFDELRRRLAGTGFTHLAAVHCETTTGILNPVSDWSGLARQYGCRLILDAMSSFGGIPLGHIMPSVDYLIASSNKCLQGAPGLGIVLANRQDLFAATSPVRSLSLDLRGQLAGFEANGQFRFTPPTHVLLALVQALKELEEEGGVVARYQRYCENHKLLRDGMSALGFREYVPRVWQSPIITSFHCPQRADFQFEQFYEALSRRGMLIYPGKVSDAACFRIGSIGHLFPGDIQELLTAIKEVLGEA